MCELFGFFFLKEGILIRVIRFQRKKPIVFIRILFILIRASLFLQKKTKKKRWPNLDKCCMNSETLRTLCVIKRN